MGEWVIMFMSKEELDNAQRNRNRQSKTVQRPDGMEYNDATKKALRKKRK